MNIRNTVLFIVLIGFLAYSKSFGQETPKELGLVFFKSLRNNDTTALKKIIPKAETLLKFSKNLGIETNENEISKFLIAYPKEVNQFTNRFIQLYEYGKSIGINWNLTDFKDVEISSKEHNISENTEPIIMIDLNVIFVSENVSYRLILNSIFEFEKRWYSSGGKPRIEKY